ncbi:hypothetical protein B0A49_08287, partial [Cryomyces minteri]
MSETPRRVTRASSRAATPAALPALPSKQSHAYGASGKLGLAPQLEPSGAGDFVAMLGGARAAAVERDIVADVRRRSGSRRSRQTSLAPSESVSVTRSRRQSQHYTERISEADEDDDNDDEEVPAPPPAAQDQGTINTGRTFAGEGQEVGGHDNRAGPPAEPPSPFEIAWEALWRARLHILKTMAAILAIILAYFLLSFAHDHINPPQSSGVFEDEGLSFNPIRSIRTFGSNVWDTASSAIAAPSKPTRGAIRDDDELVKRVMRLESDIDHMGEHLQTGIHDMQKQHGLYELTIKKLEEHLPEYLAFPKNADTGLYEIPNQFWHALKQKIEHEELFPVQSHNDVEQLRNELKRTQAEIHELASTQPQKWDDFLAQNKANVEAVLAQRLQDQTRLYVQRAVEHFDLVSKGYFAAQLNYQMDGLQAYLFEAAAAGARRYFQNMPQQQIDEFTVRALTANTKLNLETVNFFSLGAGAVVDPHLTSPTKSRLIEGPLQKLYTTFIWFPHNPAAAVALERWDEAGDCWCTPDAPERKGQIGVLMSRKMIPTGITIEHIPERATLDITSAPRRLQVWIEVKDSDERARVEAERRVICEGESVGKNFVCIGTVEYEKNEFNHVQTFPINAAGTVTSKAVVRVWSNWGQ